MLLEFSVIPLKVEFHRSHQLLTNEGETGHANGHLFYLEQVGDPATDLPIGNSIDNLKTAIAGETHEYSDMYPGYAKTARDEGFDDIAEWFEVRSAEFLQLLITQRCLLEQRKLMLENSKRLLIL